MALAQVGTRGRNGTGTAKLLPARPQGKRREAQGVKVPAFTGLKPHRRGPIEPFLA
jgi:hypothetical protein